MSQESSPITQWLYEIRELVHDKVSVNHHFMCLRLEHEENSAIPDDCSCGAEYKEIQAITSATISLIEALIDEHETYAQWVLEREEPKGLDKTVVRVEKLRQSLKEIK